jgi:monofunctional biosynthetic peptidoglycan transglycosylase
MDKIKLISSVLSKYVLVVFAGSVFLILIMAIFPPVTTAFIEIDRWTNEDKYEIQYQWVSWDNISPYVPLAMICAEDQKFTDHYGFDLESIEEAWDERQQGKRFRGASTISQQVAKNLFLWPGKFFFRKGMEAYFTVLIELFWSKKRILEMYVNIAQFGEGVYGVKEAGQKYFKKEASKITYYEAALMGAVLPNPVRLKINRPSNYVKERTEWILLQMDQMGWERFIIENVE